MSDDTFFLSSRHDEKGRCEIYFRYPRINGTIEINLFPSPPLLSFLLYRRERVERVILHFAKFSNNNKIKATSLF